MLFVKGHSKSMALEDLSFLSSSLKGNLKTKFFYQGFLRDTQSMKGHMTLTGEDISLSELKLNTLLGPLSLPSLNWETVDLKLELKEGEVLFEKVELGSSKDALKIKMRGSMALSKRFFRLQSYNIELQIDLDKNTEFAFLDLMFAGHKEVQPQFYRYSIRLVGQGSQIPKIEKLESF